MELTAAHTHHKEILTEFCSPNEVLIYDEATGAQGVHPLLCQPTKAVPSRR